MYKDSIRKVKIKKHNKNKLERNKEKGVTLIALVVTIVILLILAGLSISMLTGENGMITKTKEAKFATKIASYQEQISLYIANEKIIIKETVNKKRAKYLKSIK